MKFYNEKIVSILGVLSGIIVAFTLSLVPLLLQPSRGWKDFLSLLMGNFVIFWIPQACILGLLWVFNARPAVVAGTAISLALYLVLFYIWLYSHAHTESMAWLGYLFSLPGAGLAALLGNWHVKLTACSTGFADGCLAAGYTLIGLILNQGIICDTALYCRF